MWITIEARALNRASPRCEFTGSLYPVCRLLTLFPQGPAA